MQHPLYRVALLVGLSALVWACNGEAARADGVDLGVEPAKAADDVGATEGEPCEPGEVLPCSVDLPDHGGVDNCFAGWQNCDDGFWGACEIDESEAVAN